MCHICYTETFYVDRYLADPNNVQNIFDHDYEQDGYTYKGFYKLGDTERYSSVSVDTNSTTYTRIVITCPYLTRLPKIVSNLPLILVIKKAESVISIDTIENIHSVSINCPKLRYIGTLKNIRTLSIVDCHRIISVPFLHINNIGDDAIECMQLFKPYRMINRGKVCRDNSINTKTCSIDEYNELTKQLTIYLQ